MLTEAVIANKAYAKFSTPAECDLDTIALNVIKQDCPDFLLPIRTMEINGSLEIRYELTDGVRLSYASREMMKKDFTALLISLLTPFKVCGDWFLCRNNIYLDLDYIIVGKDGFSVKYVYIPAAEYSSTDEEIVDFFFNLILSKKVVDDEAYTVEIMRILKSSSRNSLMETLDFLLNKSQPADGQAPAVFPPMPGNAGQPTPGAQQFGPAPGPAVQHPPVREPANNQPPVRMPDRGPVGGGMNRPNEVRPDMQNTVPRGAGPGVNSVPNSDEEMKRRIMGGLYGDSGDSAANDPKKKKGGLFGSKGKQKPMPQQGQPQPPQPQFPQQMQMQQMRGGQQGGFMMPQGQPPVHNMMPQQGQPPFPQPQFPQQMPGSNYQPSDSTDIDEETVQDSSVLRLRLIENVMLNCPKYIEIPLTGGSATVGRFDKSGQPRSDYNFDASLSFVSHMHFRVERNDNAWTIIDLNSSNGTFVNNQKLVPNVKYPLAVGDTIMISAKYRMTYVVS